MTTGDMDRSSENDRQNETQNETPGTVDDEVWTELVASFHASTADRTGLWPDSENVPADPDTELGNAATETTHTETPTPDAPQGVTAMPAAPSRVVRPAARPDVPPSAPPAVTWTAAGPRDWDPPLDPDEEGFVPPPPPPLPALEAATKAAWLAGLGGPGYLALATIMHWETPQWIALLCILAGVIGFGYLVSRLKDRPEDMDDDPDDGAVV
jgi:hypothetical protein